MLAIAIENLEVWLDDSNFLQRKSAIRFEPWAKKRETSK